MVQLDFDVRDSYYFHLNNQVQVYKELFHSTKM